MTKCWAGLANAYHIIQFYHNVTKSMSFGQIQDSPPPKKNVPVRLWHSLCSNIVGRFYSVMIFTLCMAIASTYSLKS